MNDLVEQGADIGDEDGMATYENIFANLLLSEEIVLTVQAEDVVSLKTGIKNIKARQAQDSRDNNLAVVTGTLSFAEAPNKEIVGAIDVTITLSQKGSVKVLGMRVPDPDM